MKRSNNKFRSATLAVLLLTTVLVSACNDPQRALAPPNADVIGIQTVIVFPFVNETGERHIEADIVAGLTAQLQAIGWYDVLGPERVAPLLAERRIDTTALRPDSASWNETARAIALELEADGFITGSVFEYDEEVTVSPAYRETASGDANVDVNAGSSSSDFGAEAGTGESSPDVASSADTILWLTDQVTEATVTVSGKLVNVHTGETVYERTVTGRGRISEPRQLNWSVPEAPPEALVPTPHRRDIAAARAAAVVDTLNAFTHDILPQRTTTADE